MTKIFIGNLPTRATNDDLKQLFRKYGDVSQADALGDRGYGFVHMDDKRDAEDAVDELHGADFMGNRIRVEFSHGKRGGGGGGGGGRRGGGFRGGGGGYRGDDRRSGGGYGYSGGFRPRDYDGRDDDRDNRRDDDRGDRRGRSRSAERNRSRRRSYSNDRRSPRRSRTPDK